MWQSRAQGKYPKGIFWVDAKSKENAYRSFWDIGQAAALLGVNKSRNQDWDAASTYVQSVRLWLEKKTGWLLIFDGLSFDNEDEISDFLTFVPDSKGNCIIITTVDRTLRGRQRLLNPTSIKVQPLSPQDGCLLLFKSLNIRHPSEAQTSKAADLVKHYEGLPLAIHAAAHALLAKGRALETYTPGITDKRLAEPYLEIMQALRDNSHVEAVNFITLLSFFNHSIPVALISLGRRALVDFNLDIRSTDRENSNKNELDNTIAVLIKYGLITRVFQPYHMIEQSLSKETSIATMADSFSTQTGNSSESPVESRSRRDSQMTTRGLQENIKPESEVLISNGKVEGPVYATIETQTTPVVMHQATEPRPESSLDSCSTKSIKYNIDILRVHTVVQNVFRDEMRLKDRERYYWWLSVAVRLFSLSYAVADTRINASARQGLVRDYREFETQAAALRSHFPRAEKAPADLHKVRSELRAVLRKIRREIHIRSPSHSIDSLRHRVQVSIFERSSSTSTDAPDTPTDGSRTDSWSLNESLILESPTGIERPPLPDPMESSDSWDDRGYETDYASSAITTRRSSRSEIDTDMPTSRDPDAGRRASFLQAIFKGRPVPSKKQKDLGEWKPVPAAPSLTPSDVKATPSRTSSVSRSLDERKARSISAGSEAEAALAAVHRMSPPASRGGRIRSPNRPLPFDAGENVRRPLEDLNSNTQLSPLAAEFKSSTQSSSRHHSRTSSSSPRLAQLRMANAMASSKTGLPPLPTDQSVTVTRRTPVSITQSTFYGSPPSIAVNQQVQYLPTGYTSYPMSRDNSRESAHSLLSAPAATSLDVHGTSLPTRDARPAPSSIDVVAANEVEFGRIGEWSNNVTPFTPTMPGLNIPDSINAVQFGEMDPVMLEEARRRADDYARRGGHHKENR